MDSRFWGSLEAFRFYKVGLGDGRIAVFWNLFLAGFLLLVMVVEQ